MPSPSKTFIIKILIVIVLFLSFKGGVLLYQNGVDGLALVDTDCYMRLVRVEVLQNTGAWFDNTISRSNAPFGETLHWSKSLDLLLLAGAYIGSFFLAFREALFWWGYIISPVFMIVSVFALNWAARPIFRQELRIFIVLFFICQVVITSYYSFGRPDHHSLLLFLFILQIGSALRMILADGKPSVYPYISGVIAAIGMWVSVETLVPIFWIAGTLAILWIAKANDYLEALRQFFLALSVFSFIFILLERPVWQMFIFEYDKLSFVHVVSFAVTWLILRVRLLYNGDNKGLRFLSALLLAGMLLLGLNVAFPDLFKGPYVAVDPKVVEIWLSKVQEVQPISFGTRDSIAKGIISLGSLFWVLPYSFSPLIGNRKITVEWLFFHFGFLLFCGLAFYQIRWSAYAEVLILFPMVYVLSMLFDRIKNIRKPFLKSIGRVAVIIVMALGHYAAAWAIITPSSIASKTLPIHQLSVFLNHYERTGTVLAWIDLGPQLLYETKHNVIATPYHRNSAGILYWYEVMTSEKDEETHDLISQRSITYIVLCRQGPERTSFIDMKDKNMFYNRLAAGKYPDWLHPVPLSDELKDSFIIYEVIGGVE